VTRRAGSVPGRPKAPAAGRVEASGDFLVRHLPTYLDHLAVERGLSPRSIDAYGRDLAVFGQHLAERSVPTSKVSRAEIVRHLQARRAAGLSARSAARLISALRGFFAFAVAEGIAAEDPTGHVENPKTWAALPHAGCAPGCRLRAARRVHVRPEGIYARGVRVFLVARAAGETRPLAWPPVFPGTHSGRSG